MYAHDYQQEVWVKNDWGGERPESRRKAGFRSVEGSSFLAAVKMHRVLSFFVMASLAKKENWASLNVSRDFRMAASAARFGFLESWTWSFESCTTKETNILINLGRPKGTLTSFLNQAFLPKSLDILSLTPSSAKNFSVCRCYAALINFFLVHQGHSYDAIRKKFSMKNER